MLQALCLSPMRSFDKDTAMLFWLMLISPVAVFIGIAIVMRLTSPRLWLGVAVGAAALIGCGLVVQRGVSQSCEIAEAECIGANATAYMFATIWLVAAVLLAAGLVGRWWSYRSK
jgi:hypothetical protein